MSKVIVTLNIIWDYHTRLPKMFWYVTACKNINLGIYNKQIRFYAPRTSLETMSDVLNLCIKNKCPKNHDWAFIFHNWELKLKIEYFIQACHSEDKNSRTKKLRTFLFLLFLVWNFLLLTLIQKPKKKLSALSTIKTLFRKKLWSNWRT